MVSNHWKGHYLDGRSAGRQPVTVSVTPAGFYFTFEQGHQIRWPFEEIRLSQGVHAGDQVRIEHGGDLPEAIVLEDRAFLDMLAGAVPAHLKSRFRKDNRTLVRALVALAALGLVIPTAYLFGLPALGRAGAALVPVVWEEKLGAMVSESLAPQEEHCRNPELQARVTQLVSRLAKAASPQPYTFRTTVVDNPMVNAFAAPGGYMVVFRGLLEKTRNEDELAGVLAHEVQHVLLKHPTQSIFRQMTLGALIGALTGDTTGIAKVMGAAGTLGALRFGREDELSADREGMQLLMKAKLNPHGMIRAFEMLRDEAPQMPDAITYLSTHPSTGDRIARLTELSEASGLSFPTSGEDPDWKALIQKCGE